MNQQESTWDKKLKIKTCGRDASMEDINHYPYEPTPYCVLERIADSGYVTSNSLVVDYGCGKGRVDFFLSWKVGCKTLGIEYNPNLYQDACDNLSQVKSNRFISFVLCDAKDYVVSKEADCFYFFNPFNLKLLQSVIGKILDSYYTSPRNMKLFFYFPSDEYVSYLMTIDELEFYDEIDCSDLFEGNQERERVLIFYADA